MNKIRLATLNGNGRTVITVDNVKVGKDFVVIAGPCSVESEAQTIKTAQKVKEAGANMLRGGAFKPRTSPYDFQGLGLTGLKILEKAKKETGLPVVTEVTDPRDVSWISEYVAADIALMSSSPITIIRLSSLGYLLITSTPLRGMYSNM